MEQTSLLKKLLYISLFIGAINNLMDLRDYFREEAIATYKKGPIKSSEFTKMLWSQKK
jgi:hypothetical protein